jgi:hypothetical protein
VILPASAWPEKDGTVTNTNRQVQMGRKALPLPGDAREDIWIIQDLAQRMGLNWNYKNVGEVFTEMAALMPSLDNITWERIERESAVTYPVDGPDVPGRDVVFDTGIPRPNGLAKLVATKYTAPDEMPDAEYPYILTTGRQLEHWHTGAMTRRASVLDALEPGPVAGLSRGTIAKLGIVPGDIVRVATRRGVVELCRMAWCSSRSPTWKRPLTCLPIQSSIRSEKFPSSSSAPRRSKRSRRSAKRRSRSPRPSAGCIGLSRAAGFSRRSFPRKREIQSKKLIYCPGPPLARGRAEHAARPDPFRAGRGSYGTGSTPLLN